jgi:flagellar M-ring protein FliF
VGTRTTQGPALPGQLDAAGVQAPINSVAQPISTRKDSTINYEIDKTIRHTKQSVGTIKRLSAAVVVNHRKDAKGLAKPLADAELKQINELVREAMGYNKERGDTVSVANAPFTASEASDAASFPIWKDPDILALLKELFKYGAIAAVLAYLVLKIILPLSKTMMQAPPRPAGQTLGGKVNIVDEEIESHTPSAAKTLERKLDHARELAQQDPKAVANIIKDWTGSNANG